MIRYKCGRCGAKLESSDSLGGELDKCPMCGFACAVPRPKPPKRRAFLILGGAAGLLAGATLAVVITFALTSGTGPSPSPSKTSPPGGPMAGPKTAAKAVVQTVKSKPGTAPAKMRWQDDPLVEDASPAAPAPALPPGFVLDTPAPLSPEQIFEKASPAVVYITVRDKDFKPIGLGSGFFVDANGLIVTNYHVIKGAEFATARLSSGATLFLDGVVATDPNGDLALLKVSGGGFPCLKNAEPALPRIGSAVYAIGNPRGLENTFSSGMVSGHREISQGLKVIQVTAPISPGSSGGPLLNASGEVVGVTTAYLATGQNLNFAIPVSAISALIRKQGKVQTLASAGGGRLDSAETDELDKAWAAMEEKDWSAATKALTELRKTQPDNPFVWYALGYLHFALGNHEIAIEQYKQAITLKPDYAEAYSSMGDTLRQLERYREAIEAYKKAIAIEPDYAWAYRGIGLAYYRLERYREAIEAYKKVVAIEPDFADAYCFMGRVYRELKRYPEAIEAYKNAIAIKPDYPDAYSLMGRVYDELKRYPEAIEASKKAIAIKPDYPDAYSLMGHVYYELKRYPEAIAAYEQFLRLEPTGDMADLVRSSGLIQGLSFL